MCSWPWPGEQQLLGLRIAAVADRSDPPPASRCIAVLILSSSPRLFGSIAYESTGSGNLIGGNADADRPCRRACRWSSVSFSFATAPRSPALISGTLVWRLALQQRSGGRAAPACRCVTLCTVESAFERAGDDAEHRDAAGERIGDGLPDERRGRRLVVGLARDVLAVLGVDAVNGRSAGDGT